MAMQRDIRITFYAVGLIASFHTTLGSQYTVGGSLWSIPPYPQFYSDWSSSNTFYVGDSLVFDFESEFINVIQVARPDYDGCTTQSPFKEMAVSPAIVILSFEGVFYYICNISNYCDLGQKVSVVVHKQYSSSGSNPPPAPSPSPAPHPSSPQPFAPSLCPILAPQPSQGGGTNASDNSDQSPASSAGNWSLWTVFLGTILLVVIMPA